MNSTVKKLNLWSAICVVIGCVIGSGVFVKPGRVLMAAGDSNSALMAWVIGGLITLAGGLTMAEISSRYPKTGGVYVYVEELFGPAWAFVSGWVQSIIYGPALSAALSLYFASLLTQFLEISDSYVKGIGLLALFTLSFISAVSTGYSSFIQNATVFIKLIPIVVLGVCGLLMGEAEIFNVTLSNPSQTTSMGVAVLATLWAYDGWVQVSNMGDEIENPSKNLPRAFLIGIAVVMVVYILVNLSLFHVVPVDQIAVLNEKTAAVAAETLFGTMGGKLLGLGILIAIFGCLNGNIMTMPRIAYAMALRGAFPYPQVISVLHPKNQTPVNSIMLKTLISAIMVIFLNPDRITDIAMFVMYSCYGAVFLGIFILRKKFGRPEKGSYRVPLYPVVPLIATSGIIYICYSMISQAPWDALISFSISITGLPIYYWINKIKKPLI